MVACPNFIAAVRQSIAGGVATEQKAPQQYFEKGQVRETTWKTGTCCQCGLTAYLRRKDYSDGTQRRYVSVYGVDRCAAVKRPALEG